MRAIIQFLTKLFKSASRVSTRTGKGLLQHGTGRYAVNAVRTVNFTVRGVRIAYEDLNEIDQGVVDEIVQYVTRFAYQYIDHHDEHTRYRLSGVSLEGVLTDHAQEIFEAAEQALHSRLRSHGYDAIAGKPKRQAIFQDEDILKQLIIAIIGEVTGHIEEEAAST